MITPILCVWLIINALVIAWRVLVALRRPEPYRELVADAHALVDYRRHLTARVIGR